LENLKCLKHEYEDWELGQHLFATFVVVVVDYVMDVDVVVTCNSASPIEKKSLVEKGRPWLS